MPPSFLGKRLFGRPRNEGSDPQSTGQQSSSQQPEWRQPGPAPPLGADQKELLNTVKQLGTVFGSHGEGVKNLLLKEPWPYWGHVLTGYMKDKLAEMIGHAQVLNRELQSDGNLLVRP